jgi:pilus assembly protein Flp/PilA
MHKALTIFKGFRKSGDEAPVHSALMVLRDFGRDENGAALIEYTVLLGILLVAVIATIIFVGGWISSQWTALKTALPAAA